MHDLGTLNHWLHNNLPATAALGLSVNTIDNKGVLVSAPFSENKNHHDTAFGGSIALITTAAAWVMAYVACPTAKGNIVIKNSQTRYLKPATPDHAGSILAICHAPDADTLSHCHDMLNNTGKGRLTLTAELLGIDTQGQAFTAAVMVGEFVIFMPK